MLAQQIFNGLMIGAVYSLIAVGYTLVFGVVRLLNMAHGEAFMVAGIVGALAGTRLGLPLWESILLALVVCLVVGMVIHIACFRYISRNVEEAPLIATLGLGLILKNIAANATASEPAVFETTNLDLPDLQVAGIIISPIDLVILCSSIVLMAALARMITSTRLGRQLRAVAGNPLAARLMGINESRVTMYAILISTVLAGVAGILVGLRFGKVSPYVGMTVGLKGIGIMVIGGLGNVYGAMVSGLLIGLAEGLAVAYLGGAYTDMILWILLIATLMVRPQGLFSGPAGRRA